MWMVMIAGMTLGFLGSFHCVGMCGPLALSLPIDSDNAFIRFAGTLVYNIGRITTYTSFGLLLGLIGHSFSLIGAQQWISIGLGVMILVLLLMRKKFLYPVTNSTWGGRVFNNIRTMLGRLYRERSFGSLFLIGILNGLLPCGMVYMALAAAISAGDVYSSILFMAGFGLGTFPAMWAISFFASLLAGSVRMKIRKFYPYVIAIVAFLLILRGFGISISFNTHATGAMNCAP